MDKIMEVLPDDAMQVRHYQGHWYKNKDLLNTMDEKEAPLSKRAMNDVLSGIANSTDKQRRRTKRTIYDQAKAAATSNGVEWIQTVERDAKYHRKKES